MTKTAKNRLEISCIKRKYKEKLSLIPELLISNNSLLYLKSLHIASKYSLRLNDIKSENDAVKILKEYTDIILKLL